MSQPTLALTTRIVLHSSNELEESFKLCASVCVCTRVFVCAHMHAHICVFKAINFTAKACYHCTTTEATSLYSFHMAHSAKHELGVMQTLVRQNIL